MRTPWGVSQSVTEVYPGIQSVSTAGHGGYKLDRKRNAMVHEAWRNVGGWYEEDCEWAIVALTFKYEFPAETVEGAIKTLKNWLPIQYSLVTGEQVALEESSKLREIAAKEAAKGKLQSFVAWGSWNKHVPEGFVGVCAKVDGRDGAGEGRYFLIPAEEYDGRGIVFVVDPERHAEVGTIR
jgi:hypothetical protein